MLSLNRGEWSEIYVLLYLSDNPNLKIVNSHLNAIEESIFVVDEIVYPYRTKCKSANDYAIDPKGCSATSNMKEEIYYYILNAPKGKGAFSIEGNNGQISGFLEGRKRIKSSSKRKEDLVALVNDSISRKKVKVSYSIKSMLGSPATLLNSSSATNFIYTVRGLKQHDIEKINDIKSRTKLKDRIQRIYDLGGLIEFSDVENPIFKENLKMIDSQMPLYIGNALLESYIDGDKSFFHLFQSANPELSDAFVRKKICELLSAISFGMFPNVPWNGAHTVNGGFLIVEKQGDVVLLDSIYHQNEVDDFLLHSTKFDSPSSSRYHMVEIARDMNSDGVWHFTLNLQVRYRY